MINLLSFPQHGSRILLFWGAAILVYFLMVFGTLADIEQITGVRAFDMRPTGYSYADALALISALEDEGRRIYLMRQIPLDMVYPALLAISSASSLLWLSRSFGSCILAVLQGLMVVGRQFAGSHLFPPIPPPSILDHSSPSSSRVREGETHTE